VAEGHDNFGSTDASWTKDDGFRLTQRGRIYGYRILAQPGSVNRTALEVFVMREATNPLGDSGRSLGRRT
jgi:hypothetical protein